MKERHICLIIQYEPLKFKYPGTDIRYSYKPVFWNIGHIQNDTPESIIRMITAATVWKYLMSTHLYSGKCSQENLKDEWRKAVINMYGPTCRNKEPQTRTATAL